MADQEQTCRYCPSTDVDRLATPAGPVPVCEVHGAQLGRRLLAWLDQVSGQPVHNAKLYTEGAATGPAPAGPDKPDPTF